MWTIFEHRNVQQRIGKLPEDVLKRYEKWKDIVEISGPSGLRLIRGSMTNRSAVNGRGIGLPGLEVNIGSFIGFRGKRYM